MKTVAHLPEIGLAHVGPNIDDATVALRAQQLSHFMRHEVHGPVYEIDYDLPFIDPDPPSGTPGDVPWRIDAMRQNQTVQPDGSYREYIIAARLTDNNQISADLAVVTARKSAAKQPALLPA